MPSVLCANGEQSHCTQRSAGTASNRESTSATPTLISIWVDSLPAIIDCTWVRLTTRRLIYSMANRLNGEILLLFTLVNMRTPQILYPHPAAGQLGPTFPIKHIAQGAHI